MTDVIAELEFLALGSRLKRLAEAMQADCISVYAASGFEGVTPSQFPVLTALHRLGPQTVGALVSAVRMSQPGVSRGLTQLQDRGLVEVSTPSGDRRQRHFALSAKGEALYARMERDIFPGVAKAAEEICGPDGNVFLEQISGLERRFVQKGLFERAVPQVRILDYADDLAPVFHDINAEWIETMFVLEQTDKDVLSNPRKHIIDPGGDILFAATRQNGLVGACALKPMGDGAVELTKMGVRPAARGLKVGETLLDAVLQRAASKSLKTLFLLTSKKCEAAIHLYEKAGFEHDADIMAAYGCGYDRCDVAMRFPKERLDRIAAGG